MIKKLISKGGAILLLPFFLALGTAADAGVPEKRPLTYYARLWNDSPFTSKPPPPIFTPQANPLEGLVLLGVSPIQGGYRVTITEKKNPGNRIYVSSDEPNAKHGFRILGVDREPGDPMGTKVRLSSGRNVGTVSFDSKALAIAQPKLPKQDPRMGNRPGMPGMSQEQQRMINRQPRPRVIPPPSPNPQGQTMQGGR
jgi:hypothetical protein